MQLFTTYPTLEQSARVLDPVRCNCQIGECNRVFSAIVLKTPAWQNHCVTRLWWNYPIAVLKFAWCCYHVRVEAGGSPIKPITKEPMGSFQLPPFLNNPYVLNAMRSHLLNKDYTFYSQYDWQVPAKSGYWAINTNHQWQLYMQE